MSDTFDVEGEKSTSQKMADSTRSTGDDAQQQGKGVVGQVQEGIAGAAQSVSDTLSGNTSNLPSDPFKPSFAC